MKKLCVVGVLLLTACASAASGPSFNAKGPSAGKSQIVIYRPAEFGIPKKANILINGQKYCDMGPKGFAIIPVDPGPIEVSATMWDAVGSSKRLFKAEVGKTQYLRLTYHTNVNPGVMFGAIGGAIGGGMQGDDDVSGPFAIRPVFEGEAEQELASLRQGC